MLLLSLQLQIINPDFKIWVSTQTWLLLDNEISASFISKSNSGKLIFKINAMFKNKQTQNKKTPNQNIKRYTKNLSASLNQLFLLLNFFR